MRRFTSLGNTVAVAVLCFGLLCFAALATIPVHIEAQGAYDTSRVYDAFGYEALTVSTAAIGLTSTVYSGTGQAQVQKLVCTTETNSVRYRYDGTDPTASEGHLVAAPGTITLYGARNIGRFRAIRASADAAMKCTVER